MYEGIMKIFIKLSWFMKQEKASYIWGILSLAVIAVLNLIPPMITATIIDEMTNGTLTVQTLLLLVVGLFINAAIIFAMRYVWRICIFGASFRLERLLRLRLFEHFAKMSPSFFKENRVGDLMAHATNDLKSVQRVAGIGVLQGADALISGLSTLVAMIFFVDLKLTLITLIPMPFMIIGAQMLSKKLHTTFHKAQDAFSNLNNRTLESINGIKVTKTFGQEKEEVASFKEETQDVYKKNMAYVPWDAGFDPLIEIIVVICYILLFITGATMIENHQVSVGQLTAMVSYMNLLIWPMLALGFLYNNVERGNVSYDRIQKLFDVTPEVRNVKNAIQQVPTGDITFDVQDFRYEDSTAPVIDHVQFSVKPKETLGIVGKTGAGKTTLIKLLLRESDSFKGSIHFGDYETYRYDLGMYHQAFGYVPQDQFLFSMSIADNIRFGKSDASMEEVKQAAKLANVHEDIEGFAEGYETMVGERGVSLSGGQKQRIAIARALLLDPEVLILDDSLSAVDAKTEERILTSLKEVRNNKTTIIVAHRFSAIKHANQIIVMDQGKIIERGIHDQLAAGNGWYAEIYKLQETYQGGTSYES